MHRRNVALAMLLCILMLSACAIGNTNTTATPAVTKAAVTKAAETAGSTNGERPSLLTNDNVTLPGELPICVETETLTLGMVAHSTVISYDYANNYQTQWMQDTSNVIIELELFPSADANQKLELMITSGAKLPDIIHEMGVGNDSIRETYAKAGAIIPLNDYYDQLGYFFDQNLANSTNDSDWMSKEDIFSYTASSDGNVYGTITYMLSLLNCYCNRAWINQSWLEKLELDEPTTSEEFLAVLTAFRDEDPNGNGEKDEIPMVGANDGWNSNPIEWIMNQFIYCSKSGTSYYSLLNDGVIEATFDTEEWREGLRFMKGMVDEGLLSTLSFTQNSTQYTAQVTAETQIVGVGVSGSVAAFGKNRPDYMPLGAIKGPEGVQWATFTPWVPTITSVITKDCESPDLAFRWLDMGYMDDYLLISTKGEKGVDWEYTDEGESMFSDLGYKVVYKVINNIWGTDQQKMWVQHPLPFIALPSLFQGDEWDGVTNADYKAAVVKLSGYTPDKENIIYKIIYTGDEIDQYSVLRTTLVNYIQESMVRFVMGDLNLDTDWDDYLAELVKLKYEELIAVDQVAYDRTKNN